MPRNSRTSAINDDETLSNDYAILAGVQRDGAKRCSVAAELNQGFLIHGQMIILEIDSNGLNIGERQYFVRGK